MAPCKLYIFTLFSTLGLSWWKNRSGWIWRTIFLGLHCPLLHGYLHHKKVQKLKTKPKKPQHIETERLDFALLYSGVKYKAARSQVLELKSLRFSRNGPEPAPRIPRAMEVPWLAAALGPSDTLFQLSAANSAKGGIAQTHRFLFASFFLGVISISV